MGTLSCEEHAKVGTTDDHVQDQREDAVGGAMRGANALART